MIENRPSQKPPVIECPRATAVPAVDGNLDDPCWKTAVRIENFKNLKNGGSVKWQTRCRLLADEKFLYVGVEAMNDMAGIKEPDMQSKNYMWGKDELDLFEIFIEPWSDSKQQLYQFVINPFGDRWEFFHPGAWAREDTWDRPGWNLDWEAKTIRHQNCWMAEIAIPFYGLGIDAGTTSEWKINFLRENFLGNEISVWSPTYDSIINNRHRYAVLSGMDSNLIDRYRWSIENLKLQFPLPQMELSFVVRNQGNAERMVCIQSGQGRGSVTTLVPAGTSVPVCLPVDVSPDLSESCKIDVEISDAESGFIVHRRRAKLTVPRLLTARLEHYRYRDEKEALLFAAVDMKKAYLSQCRINMEVKQSDKILFNKETDLSGNTFSYTLPMDQFANGEYDVLITLEDGKRKILVSAGLTLRKAPLVSVNKRKKRTESRFLLDCDGDWFCAHMTDNVEQSIAEVVAGIPDNVTTYMLCSGCSKYNYPTRVGEVLGSDLSGLGRENFLPGLHSQGIDPFGIFLQALRKAGKETFITYRMNDLHADSPDHPEAPEFKKKHPDYVIDPEAVGNKTGAYLPFCFDYSRVEVREYIMATIRELVEWYEIDGLQLDWMRFPRHLPGSPEQAWEKRDVITGFIADVRKLLDESGKDILLSARVPTNPEGCRCVGLDISEWTYQGLVDFIVATPFLTTDFSMPIRDLRNLMKEHPVPIYADIDCQHGPCQQHCPESLRAAALGLFESGADGLYLFNFNPPGLSNWYWLYQLDKPEKVAQKPLLFSIAHKLCRQPDIDLPWQLPVGLASGKTLELQIYLPETVFPIRCACFLVHSGGDISLLVNEKKAEERPSLRRPELFVEYIGEEENHRRPRKTDCRIFAADVDSLKPGENILRLVNTDTISLEINRINLGLW